jgi:hypothetical protein
MNRLNTGFSRLPNEELDNKADDIIKALTGNAKFPTPNPALAVVQGKLDAYREHSLQPAQVGPKPCKLRAMIWRKRSKRSAVISNKLPA